MIAEVAFVLRFSHPSVEPMVSYHHTNRSLKSTNKRTLSWRQLLKYSSIRLPSPFMMDTWGSSSHSRDQRHATTTPPTMMHFFVVFRCHLQQRMHAQSCSVQQRRHHFRSGLPRGMPRANYWSCWGRRWRRRELSGKKMYIGNRSYMWIRRTCLWKSMCIW